MASPTDKEIIIINDGSTDDTGRIIDDYAHEHACIRAYHQANIGAGATRNHALDIATGKWIIFVDADDVVFNEANLNALSALADQQSVDVIKGLYLFSSDADAPSIKPPVLDGVVDKHQAVTVSGRAFLEKCFGVHRFQTNNSFLIRRATIEKFGLRFDPAQFIGEDVLFFYQLLSDDIKVMEVLFCFIIIKSELCRCPTPAIRCLISNMCALELAYSIHYSRSPKHAICCSLPTFDINCSIYN